MKHLGPILIAIAGMVAQVGVAPAAQRTVAARSAVAQPVARAASRSVATTSTTSRTTRRSTMNKSILGRSATQYQRKNKPAADDTDYVKLVIPDTLKDKGNIQTYLTLSGSGSENYILLKKYNGQWPSVRKFFANSGIDGAYADENYDEVVVSKDGTWTSGSIPPTIYAKKDVAKYNITYNCNGGEPISGVTNPAICEAGSKPNLTIANWCTAPEGKTFVKWRIDSTSGSEFTNSKTCSADTTLYAEWKDQGPACDSNKHEVERTSCNNGVVVGLGGSSCTKNGCGCADGYYSTSDGACVKACDGLDNATPSSECSDGNETGCVAKYCKCDTNYGVKSGACVRQWNVTYNCGNGGTSVSGASLSDTCWHGENYTVKNIGTVCSGPENTSGSWQFNDSPVPSNSMLCSQNLTFTANWSSTPKIQYVCGEGMTQKSEYAEAIDCTGTSTAAAVQAVCSNIPDDITFEGWQDSDELVEEGTPVSCPESGTKTLTAKWSASYADKESICNYIDEWNRRDESVNSDSYLKVVYINGIDFVVRSPNDGEIGCLDVRKTEDGSSLGNSQTTGFRQCANNESDDVCSQ